MRTGRAVHKGQLRREQRKHKGAEDPDPLHTLAASSDRRTTRSSSSSGTWVQRELSGMRQSINDRLDRVAMLLRRLRRIPSNLERIAAAMVRGPPNAPPAPVVPLPPPVVTVPPPVMPLPPPPIPSPSTCSTRSTSRIARTLTCPIPP
ncbi:mitochondrial fission regulator 1-like [Alosa sapidissima]|uniref:mitochondrial fission regulator 1-like n=1 Tax=Alosa sapidissima TaxID=34773 RepID=UPI001C089DC4|nr:mitochondrial fission regulator 1-like [Alosa sapidissima]